MTSSAAGRQAAQPHRPALGLTHRVLGRLHFTGVFWYRLHYWVATKTPAWVRRPGLIAFTTGFLLTTGRVRRAVAANLEPVLGPAGLWTRWRRAYRTLHTFAHCLTERYQRMGAMSKVDFAIEGEPYWREATADGRGAVVVTAHIGPWENGVYLGADHERRIVHIVREEEIDSRAQDFIRTRIGGDHIVTHFAGDDPRLALELAEALRKGELVALQGDRPRAGGRTIPARIFGKPMPLPVGPAALARAANVPLLPVFNFREGHGANRTVIRPPLNVPRTANRDADHAAAVHQLAREIEWAIRERPHQWFCFRNLWG
jgi:lauroyl/myristoyl acyltransferase